ncbi:MAG: CopG family transcriptional regulator [Candidatus Komeilibacteria bacterium RIFCSPLOWO2_01_FULL_45_10]|uniref:CopG family transcriptional regulator n=1 Tax=Candidatus Komeilibacteria bacterium RIFCSPLOWO2_01_FULL_45_10 TaxID=1798550 RepID=A0A1G2BLC0_9BACT|nr:MAG: CopG family transcriptional regulator [Candidatus Komeilibacteria bacterium RIFCSPLOWO2_01_FULL_45_10]
MKKANKYTTVSLPLPLNDKIKDLIKNTGFNSVSSFVTYVLRQVVSEGIDKEAGFSKSDEAKVKERLKSLGYM